MLHKLLDGHVLSLTLLSGPAGYVVNNFADMARVGEILIKFWMHCSSWPKGRSMTDSSLLKGATTF